MAQFARPASDSATGSWSSTPLWSKIDEGSPGDDTTITSDNNTSPDNADFTINSVTDPESSSSHVLRAAWNKDSSGGHSINAVLELYQGDPAGAGSLIATLSVTGIGATEQEDSYTLNGTEADNITDYSDLYLRLSRQGDTGGNPNGRRSLVVDFAELEVPDATSDTPVSMDPGSFTLAGQDASVTRQLLVKPDSASFAFTGLDNTITRSLKIAMDIGTLTFSGLDNAVTRQLLVSMDAGSFTFSGLDASISISGGGVEGTRAAVNTRAGAVITG